MRVEVDGDKLADFVAEARAVLREIAEMDPHADSICFFCNGVALGRPDDHFIEGCLWLRARKLVGVK